MNMQLYKIAVSILVLLGLLIPFTIPTEQTLNINKTAFEKMSEYRFIKDDISITRDLNIRQLVSQIKPQLHDIKNKEQLSEIIAEYPQVSEIIEVYTTPNNYFNFFRQSSHYPDAGNLFSQNKNTILIPVNKNLTYELKLDPEFYESLEKKQEIRMFTITYLQNSKWKTTPTKYSPKKKLGLNINDNLPDLKPNVEDKGLSHYIQNEVLIKFKGAIDEHYLEQLTAKYNLQIIKKNNTTVILHSNEQNTKQLIKLLEANELSQNSPIEYIEPHFIYLTNEENEQIPLPQIPNDLLYMDYQWNLPMIFTEEGWEITRGKEDVIVAVIDTGVDLYHPEFENRLVDGINIIEPNSAPLDDDGHGTHVAGIISANTNNNEGIAGITWYNKIMPIKVLDQSGAGTLFDVAEGIIWATDNGAKVINLSLGNYAESKYLHDAVKYAYSKDVVMIAATGNDNTDELGYPASYPEVLGVSAINSRQSRAEFSNYGDYVDVVAPGVNIPSTYPGNQYAALSGTSMASPHVAGLAGLVRATNPSLTNEEVYQLIKDTAIDLGPPGRDKYYGYGQININGAVQKATSETTVEIPEEVEDKDNIFTNWLMRLKKAFGF